MAGYWRNPSGNICGEEPFFYREYGYYNPAGFNITMEEVIRGVFTNDKYKDLTVDEKRKLVIKKYMIEIGQI